MNDIEIHKANRNHNYEQKKAKEVNVPFSKPLQIDTKTEEKKKECSNQKSTFCCKNMKLVKFFMNFICGYKFFQESRHKEIRITHKQSKDEDDNKGRKMI